MPRVRFHKPGQYAHSNPKIKHHQVPSHQLEQDVNDDMLAQCVKYDWAEPFYDDRVEETEETEEKSEPLLATGAEEKKAEPKPPSKKKAASRKKAAARKPSALE